MRLGLVRRGSTVLPGLYAIGSPDATSPVLATANSTPSFDRLRRAARTFDAWILVLETSGHDVGRDELIRRIDKVGLSRVVVHRRLILSRLGAPGKAARDVGRCGGFEVVCGPVEGGDLEALCSRGG
jgi:CO dehydrogenase/acetyl-CoA synthase gamma subunit (corrinoid Fe-S protein)